MKRPSALTTPASAAPASPRPSGRLAGNPAHEIRIIGGQWKRTRIAVADLPGLRPTPDRVRETLFNWLGQDLGGWRCLDALVRDLLALKSRLDASAVTVQRGDGLAAIRHAAPASLDLLLLDPPFEAPYTADLLAAAAAKLAAGGKVYLEAPRKWDDAELAPLGLRLHRHLKAGSVHAHLLVAIAD